MKKIFIIILFLLMKESAGILFAQSIRIGALPMQFNPSFAGSTGNPRFAAIGNYLKYNQNYPTGFGHMNYNTAFSWDNFITKYSTGVGIMVNYNHITWPWPPSYINYDNRGTFSATGVIAPKISIRGKYTLSPSIGLHYLHSEYTRNYPQADITASSFNQFSLQGGLLFNAEKYYLGAAYFRKGLSTSNTEDEYKINNHGTLALSAGYVFKRPGSKFSFSLNVCLLHSPGIKAPALFMQFSGNYNRHTNVQINLNFKYKHLIWGVGNGLMVGYQNDKIRLTYTQCAFGQYAFFGPGEISARVILNKKKGKTLNITNVTY